MGLYYDFFNHLLSLGIHFLTNSLPIILLCKLAEEAVLWYIAHMAISGGPARRGKQALKFKQTNKKPHWYCLPISWFKYFHHSWCQATNMKSLNPDWEEVHTIGSSLYEPAPKYHCEDNWKCRVLYHFYLFISFLCNYLDVHICYKCLGFWLEKCRSRLVCESNKQ